MYKLYFNKEKQELKISKMGKVVLGTPTEEVFQYNDCNYTSTNRKALKEKAIEIQKEWLEELEVKIDKIKNIKL